jgi:hypothetical protein
MSDAVEDIVVEETVAKKKKIPQTAGANLKEPIMENIKLKVVKYDVTLDDREEDIVELMEKNENIEFSFKCNALPRLSEDVVNRMGLQSRRAYYRELDAKEAFERREKQEADDEFLGTEFESLSTPTFGAFFEPTAAELEKYPNGKFVFVHKRPEEVAQAEKFGYEKLGTVEGTPITPKGEKAFANMVRMVIPKDKHDKMLRYFARKSSERVGGEGDRKTEFIENFDEKGEVTATTTYQGNAESLRLRKIEKS